MSYPAQPPSAEAPYGVAPNGQPYSDKSKVVAGLLQLFLGTLGIGRFYTGHTGMAVGQLLTCGGLGLWSLIDAIIFFVSDTRTDKQGRLLRS
ncbi:TM2 domain-containing protein [Streptomyces sp. NPDC051776]|uniref:TM2 domain-containing protein n=1 Tax=Streptomyces sp. NPDC051776 TaxID=3155414 RepID=UPI00341360DA